MHTFLSGVFWLDLRPFFNFYLSIVILQFTCSVPRAADVEPYKCFLSRILGSQILALILYAVIQVGQSVYRLKKKGRETHGTISLLKP